MVGPLAALGAAMAWTGASALWRSLSSLGTAFQLNGWKNGLATVVFLPVLLSIAWVEQREAVVLLFISGLVGIAAGDTFYLGALRRLGTRRTLTTEACGPVLACIGSVYLMGEPMPIPAWIGAVMVGGAVTLVASQSHDDQGRHQTRTGLLLALASVLCGLTGAFIARQVLITSPLTALQTASIRLLAGWVGLLPLLKQQLVPRGIPQRLARRLLLATFLGTNLGILLQQLVLQEMPVGQAVTLMSTAPVMALTLAKVEKDRLQVLSVVAALLALGGVALTSL